MNGIGMPARTVYASNVVPVIEAALSLAAQSERIAAWLPRP